MNKVVRTVTHDVNGVQERRWEFQHSRLTTFDWIKVYVCTFISNFFLFAGLLYLIPIYLVYAYDIFSLKTIVIFVALYFGSFLVFHPHLNASSWFSVYVRNHALWDWCMFYTEAMIIRRGTDEEANRSHFLFGISPHGILAANRVCFLGDLFYSEIYPQTTGRFAAATPHFYLPGLRELSHLCAACDARRSVLDDLLDSKQSAYLWPGGSREIFTTDSRSKTTKLVLADRKGFIKLAIRHGVDVVPVMQFGEKWLWRKHDFSKEMKESFLSWFKLPAVLYYGRFGLWPHYLQPDGKTPIKFGMVYGEPIKVNQMDNPTQEYLDEIHGKFIASLVFLFETYKSTFNYSDDENLEVVGSRDV